MSLTAAQISRVLHEIRPALRNGWIQKIFQPGPRTVVLEIRTTGKTLSLLISIEVSTARLHLVSRKLPNPPVPPPFCRYLRAHVQGAALDAIEQVGEDRIIRFEVTTQEGHRSLLAELTGRRTNLYVLDQQNRILAALDREQAAVGETYASPPRRAHTESPADESSDRGADPAISNSTGPYPVSTAIEAKYQDLEEELAHERLRQARLNYVRKALKKTERRIDGLRGDLEKAARYHGYARYGELLKANLGMIEKGQQQIAVVDYYDPLMPELVIPLDPSKGPQGNMDDYFKKHRKHLTAEREVRPRLTAAEQELESLRRELSDLRSKTWHPPEEAPSGAAPAARPPRRPSPLALREPTKPDHSRTGPFRRFLSADGLPIYVGRNARENDELTFKFAHSDDLWLHARGTPGSHVVVRMERGGDPPPETIRDAATLALLYSDLKKSGKGEVIYTRKKWVKKLKGQPPGTVSVTQDKSIYAQLDQARLDRLKDTHGR